MRCHKGVTKQILPLVTRIRKNIKKQWQYCHMNSSEQLSSSSCFRVAQDFHDLGHILVWVLLHAENLTYLFNPDGDAHLCFLWLSSFFKRKKRGL